MRGLDKIDSLRKCFSAEEWDRLLGDPFFVKTARTVETPEQIESVSQIGHGRVP
jgi:hypothetical protein